MSDRMMLSVFRGLAPVSMPASWLEGFDMQQSFACVGDEARIRFPNGHAFGIQVWHDGPEVSRTVRLLSQAEIDSTEWRAFGPPFEAYATALAFGHGPLTRLDDLVPG